MAKKGGGKGKGKGAESPAAEGIKPVCRNKKAQHKFLVLDRLECGLVLLGTEVKSMREGGLNLDESYVRVDEGELWLVGAHIAQYDRRGYAEHKPDRRRKLLAHRRELTRLGRKVREKGLTLAPLRVYFKKGRAKVEVGLCRGRKLYDKRESMKQKDARREMGRAMSRRR